MGLTPHARLLRNPCMKFPLPTMLVVLTVSCANFAQAEDWPTYRHDNTRQGATAERLSLPLKEAWVYQAPAPPKTAWAGPDGRIIEGHLLRHRDNYDDTFQVAVVGERLYFGSSVDHHLHCFDLKSGNPVWSFPTGAPIRLAPTVWEGKVYFGSDDGFAYALDASDGKLLWKLRPGPVEEWLLARGNMISRWPVRTGITIADGLAYFGAGIFPHEDVYLYAVDAKTGKTVWKRDNISETDAGRNDLSPQGYLLANDNNLFVPSGRSLPAMLDRKTGEIRTKPTLSWRKDGVVGGTRAILADGQLYTGGEHVYVALDEETGKSGHGWMDAHQVAISGDDAYLATGTQILKIDRKTYLAASRERMELEAKAEELAKKVRTPGPDLAKDRIEYAEVMKTLSELAETGVAWKTPSASEGELILADHVLIAGGSGRVDAFDIATGKEVWTAKVNGDASGLAVANGHLIVSTTEGSIHVFSNAGGAVAQAGSQIADVPKNETYDKAAKELLNAAKIRAGFCLVVGAETGELARALAFNCDLQIYGIEPDAQKVEAARKKLLADGLYGSRVTIHQGDLSAIPYSNYFANLIVSDTLIATGEMPGDPEAIGRHLKPCGGKIVLWTGTLKPKANLTIDTLGDWLAGTKLTDQASLNAIGSFATLTRNKLPGAGEWTHLYANAGNIATTEDYRIKGGLGVLWYGDPGPGEMVNRHDGAVGPLAVNGRLIVQGESTIMAYDAYNGQFLWERDNSKAFRTGVFQNQNPGNLVGTEDFVFVMVRDVVEQIDAATGELVATHKLPEGHRENREWGYLAYQEGRLFGTSTVRTEVEQQLRRRGRLYEDATDVLFAIDVKTGKLLWKYQGKSIVHHTIALGPGRAYLIDSTLTPEQRQALLDEDKTELAKLSGEVAKARRRPHETPGCKAGRGPRCGDRRKALGNAGGCHRLQRHRHRRRATDDAVSQQHPGPLRSQRQRALLAAIHRGRVCQKAAGVPLGGGWP